jgi:predicted TIM-barrel fold metal-dependent hydrolase
MIRLAAVLVFTAALCLGQQTPAYIDLHIHWSDNPEFVKKLVEQYGKRNALACVSARPERFTALQDAARKNPGTISPILWIDLDDDTVLADIDKAHQAGFRGVKIHSPEKNYDDPAYFPVFARLERYRMMALLHTGISFRPADKIPRTKGSVARMRPMYLDTLARAFPELNLIGAHLGNPFYDEAAEVARWNPNVWFDMTGSTLIKKSDDLASFKKYLWWGLTSGQAHMPKDTPHAFEKIVFGTDNDPLDVVIDRYNKLFDACQVPQEVRKKVFLGTATKLLGMPQ